MTIYVNSSDVTERQVTYISFIGLLPFDNYVRVSVSRKTRVGAVCAISGAKP